ncbi:MAG TPA: MOSC N-terminal beta barrel domain-containing protein [Candidatus Binataceae bacterium]|nr:MOSC N-terminal beta barrel domain-containing protein [Candidatus Binataceae bacterium]
MRAYDAGRGYATDDCGRVPRAMAIIQVGVVSELWRYPVKSMRGERLREMTVTAEGALGDRVYALRELKYGAIMSAKLWPWMLEMRAAWSAEPGASGAVVRVETPEGGVIQSDSPQSAEILSDLFKHPVRLERTRQSPISPADIEAIQKGEAFLPQWKFYDEGPLHLLATGTLQHLSRLEGGAADFDPRRFRPNILIDTGDDAAEFIEDRWLAGVLQIGQTVQIGDMWPAIRCVMTTHPQETLRHDPAVLHTAAQYHQAYVGVFAGARVAGAIKVGDPVMLATA